MVVLFEEQDVSGFAMSPYGFYMAMIGIPAPFVLEDGKTYTILWDGVKYTRNAFAFTDIESGYPFVGLGNTIMTDGVSNSGEPFALSYNANYGGTDALFAFSVDTQESHTIAIYKNEPNDIVLKNPHGEDAAYGDYKKIRLNKLDGSKAIYSEGETVVKVLEQSEIDFSNGNLTIKPDDGKLFSYVFIPVPNNLKSENIAEDVVIAGIKGTHKSEGSDGSIAYYENPSVTTIPAYIYKDMNFESVKFDRVTRVETQAFQNCTKLKKADFGAVEYFGIAAFNCGWTPCIEHIIIRTTKKCELDSVNPTLLYGFGVNSAVSIYVPQNLLNSYKSDVNWSYHADCFKAIEDYPHICG